jgi:hypothetical protein
MRNSNTFEPIAHKGKKERKKERRTLKKKKKLLFVCCLQQSTEEEEEEAPCTFSYLPSSPKKTFLKK